ncbi:MFS transporter [Biformimicrobium ophioploci]|nr:MFS transporter [Microbulbifer sp. NKW57]
MRIHNKYAVEAIVFFSYVLFAMAWVGATANMGAIMAAMGIETLAAASMLSGSVTVAKIVGTFIAAIVAVRLGIKAAFLVSALMIGVGLLTPFAPNYELLLISRFVVGLGGALMVVYFNPIVLRWFEPGERPVINGINAVAFNAGTAVVLWLIEDLTALFGGWENTLSAFSIASIVLAGLWMLVDFDTPTAAEQPAAGTEAGAKRKAANEETQGYGYGEGLRDSFNWRYALSYSGVLCFYICLFTFYPKAGITQGSLVMWAGIAGTLAGMYFSRRVPARIPVIRWSGLIMSVCVAGLSFSDSELYRSAFGLVLGFVIFFPVTALVTLPQELPRMTPERITVVFSLFYSISYLISTFILWLFGWLVDSNGGDFSSAFSMITLVSTTLFIGSFFLPETAPKKQAEASAPIAESA